MPYEIADAIPLRADGRMRPTIADCGASLLARAACRCDRVFTRFRTRFLGKASPVHFFWGSFDLAVTRFSGRRRRSIPAACRICPTAVAREAYSHEVSQRRLLAGRRRASTSRRSMPTPIRRRRALPRPPSWPGPGVLFERSSANSSCPTRPSERAARDPDEALLAIPAEHL